MANNSAELNDESCAAADRENTFWVSSLHLFHRQRSWATSNHEVTLRSSGRDRLTRCLRISSRRQRNVQNETVANLGADLMMLSTRRIISAASAPLTRTWRLTWYDSVIPRFLMHATSPSSISGSARQTQGWIRRSGMMLRGKETTNTPSLLLFIQIMPCTFCQLVISAK